MKQRNVIDCYWSADPDKGPDKSKSSESRCYAQKNKEKKNRIYCRNNAITFLIQVNATMGVLLSDNDGVTLLSTNLLSWSLCCKATDRSWFQRWDEGVCDMDLEPGHFGIISNLLQICQRWGPCGKLPRRVFPPWDDLTRCNENQNPLCLIVVYPESSMGVGNIFKMESSQPRMIYTPIVCLVFPTNISDLLGRSQDKLEFCGTGVLSEWVTLKAVLKGLSRVTFWLSWACDWEPTSYNDLCRNGAWLRFWPF